MNAKQIREMPNGYDYVYLREIAAQLAEMNEKLGVGADLAKMVSTPVLTARTVIEIGELRDDNKVVLTKTGKNVDVDFGVFVKEHPEFKPYISYVLAKLQNAIRYLEVRGEEIVGTYPKLVRGEDRSLGRLSEEGVAAEVIEKEIEEIRSGRRMSPAIFPIGKIAIYLQKEVVRGKETVVMRMVGGQ